MGAGCTPLIHDITCFVAEPKINEPSRHLSNLSLYMSHYCSPGLHQLNTAGTCVCGVTSACVFRQQTLIKHSLCHNSAGNVANIDAANTSRFPTTGTLLPQDQEPCDELGKRGWGGKFKGWGRNAPFDGFLQLSDLKF